MKRVPRISSLLALVSLAAACASKNAPKPAGNASSIEVQYEANPDAGRPVTPTPPAVMAFWKDRQDLIAAPPPPKPSPLALPGLERWKLDNGLEVIVVGRKDLPVTTFSIAFRAGGYDEDKNKTLGVADFTAAMLRRGTEKRSADDISRAIDFVGGTLDTDSSNEASSASCSSLSKDAKLCLDLLSDIVQRPSFPEAEMGEVRDQMLAALRAVYDSPQELASQHFDNQLFGEKNPDGWILTPEVVQQITASDLRDFWKAYYRPNNAILAVAGDVDVPRLKSDLQRAFGRWASAPVPQRPAFKAPELRPTRILLVDRPDLTQATIIFGHRGIAHADPRWYAVTVMNYVLGGSDFSSRLMREVRSKRGLTYGIGSSFGAPLYVGAFRVQASTRNETAWEALVASVNEVRRMKLEGPTVDEVAKARGYYAGSTPFALQTPGGVAASIVRAELQGLGVDYVRELAVRLGAITDVEGKQAAGDVLFPDTLQVVVVGKGDVVEADISKTGIRYERIDWKAPISQAARARLRKPQPSETAPPPTSPEKAPAVP